jgi:hypothetical protein
MHVGKMGIGAIGGAGGGIIGLITGLPVCVLLSSNREISNIGSCLGSSGTVGCIIGASIGVVAATISNLALHWLHKSLQNPKMDEPMNRAPQNVPKAALYGALIGAAYGMGKMFLASPLAKVATVALVTSKYLVLGSLVATVAALAQNIFGILCGLAYFYNQMKTFLRQS